MSLEIIEGIPTPVEFGESVENFEHVQDYLVQFGFMEPPYRTGTLDKSTAIALVKFQEFRGFVEKGKRFDAAVKAEIIMPRCGMPVDVRRKDFGRLRCAWGSDVEELHYLISDRERPRGLKSNDVADAVRAAFDTWQTELLSIGRNLRFTPTKDPLEVDIAFQWRSVDNNLRNGAWGHADYPPRCASIRTRRRPIHLSVRDSRREKWSLGRSRSGRDVQSAVLHEIGHVLGLGDVGGKDAVMSDTLDFNTERRCLGPNEKLGLRELYAPIGP